MSFRRRLATAEQKLASSAKNLASSEKELEFSEKRLASSEKKLAWSKKTAVRYTDEFKHFIFSFLGPKKSKEEPCRPSGYDRLK